MNNKNLYNIDSEYEIDLKEFFLIIWNRKILVTTITCFAAIISIFYSLSLSNIYTSSAILAPSTAEDSLSSKLGGYSSLAGLAGINLPKDSGGKSNEAIERIKSYDFFVNEFIPNIEFKNLVAARKWNNVTNTIEYDKKIFSSMNNKWVREAKYPKLEKPSNQEAFEIYTKLLTITQDSKTSFIYMELEHISPSIAQKWLKLIIKNINNHMREIDKELAKNSIDFLNTSAKKTNLSEIKLAISKLAESQMQILTLAESNKDYVLKPISSPIAPEKKSKPSRAIICFFGTFLGFIISIFISFFLHYFYYNEQIKDI